MLVVIAGFVGGELVGAAVAFGAEVTVEGGAGGDGGGCFGGWVRE